MDVFYETGGMMDTSKENIEKCSKATEIQEAWEPAIGDWYCYYGTTLLGIIELREFRRSGTFPYKNKVTFLPRQDQLQGMVSDNWYRTINKFYDYVTNDGYAEPGDPDHEEKDLDLALIQRVNSMEQLWLAFVMKEKYNKTWDGTDWVKVEEQS